VRPSAMDISPRALSPVHLFRREKGKQIQSIHLTRAVVPDLLENKPNRTETERRRSMIKVHRLGYVLLWMGIATVLGNS
jgi:hypothetical protein